MYFNNISFILHQPQLSENIGACARAIKNFKFKNLVIVKPKPIFPNDKILATSVGAKDLIVKAKIHETLESAVKKVDCVIATSARFRNKNIKHIKLNDLKKIEYNEKVGDLSALICIIGSIFALLSRYAVLFWDQGLHQGASMSLDKEENISNVFYLPLLLCLLGFFSLFLTILLIRTRTDIRIRRTNSLMRTK